MPKKRTIIIFVILAIISLILGILTHNPTAHHEDIKVVMRDAVLHDVNKISILGVLELNPGIVAGFVVTGIILGFALLARIFFIPKFAIVPTKMQILLEELVGFFEKMAIENSPHQYKLLSVYIFSAGVYIFVGTFFELFGLQAMSTVGNSVTLPAPLTDINAAISMGFLSFFFIMSGGIKVNGAKGIALTLKDFSLPISMSFRLFGALLSGLLVTDLVYHYIQLSFFLPVVVAVLFTLLHAVIQSYVLTMLTALFYGEVSEFKPKKEKIKKEKIKQGHVAK